MFMIYKKNGFEQEILHSLPGKWQKLLFGNDEETSEVPVPNYVSPLGSNSMSCDESSISQEKMVIAEKGFYLHPSPLQTPRERELDLLLFGSV